MFNQQTEDTKKHSQAATLAPLQFCSLFGAGVGGGAADYISQPEPTGRTWPRPLGGIYAALRWQPPYAMQRCTAPQPGDRAIGRTQSLEARMNSGRGGRFVERRLSLATCRGVLVVIKTNCGQLSKTTPLQKKLYQAKVCRRIRIFLFCSGVSPENCPKRRRASTIQIIIN
jgi:hypothetical protein